MARYRSFRDLDWPLLIISLVICTLGVLQIYSATHDTKWHNAWWKQILWILIGIGLMWITISVDYHTLLGQVPILYYVVDCWIDRDGRRRERGVPCAPVDSVPVRDSVSRSPNLLKW